MGMRLSELIRELQDLEEDHEGEDPEVRLAMQPNYPLAFHINGIAALDGSEVDEDEEDEDEDEDEKETIVWIAASEGNCYDHPYAPRAAWH